MNATELPEHGLSKSLWTEADFDTMGWHDARLYCFTVFPESFELVMDVDYITKWVPPRQGEDHFKFWVAPATLVLRDVQNISAVIEMTGLRDVDILNLRRTRPAQSTLGSRWTFELTAGEIALDASGYVQYFRRAPVLRACQQLEFDERGGISYARITFDGSE